MRIRSLAAIARSGEVVAIAAMPAAAAPPINSRLFISSPDLSECSGILQCLLHLLPADASGGLRCARAAPMCLQTDCLPIAGCGKSFELCSPVNVARSYRGPVNLALCVFHRVFAVAVTDAVFGKQIPRGGEGIQFAGHDGISGIPVQEEMRRLNAGQSRCRLSPGGSIAFELILDNQ